MKKPGINLWVLVTVGVLGLVTSSCFSISKETENGEEVEVSYDSESGENVDIEINTEDDGDMKINIDLKDPVKALEGLAEKLNGEGEEVEVINFRDLKEMLPNRVAGMKLDESSGETSGALGFKISTAKGEYEDGDKEMEVNIADVGSSPMVLMGMAAWSNVEFERDSDEGYERTTIIDGHKAYEKYDSNRENGQIALIINNRFLVSVEGRNISEKDLRSALKRVDLDELKELSEQ
ncbi:MAG: hypothetical protein AAF694_26440 [Bacteroidota bacterium]